MMGVRQWWRHMAANFWRARPNPEAVRDLQEIEQEIETATIEEQIAQTVAQVARIHPNMQPEQAEREIRELTIRRRSLEAQRDVLLRQQRSGHHT